MQTVEIIIERSDDMFCAYADNVSGIYGFGDTVKEAKESVMKSIQIFKKENIKKNIPAILKKDFTIEYKFDIQSLLNYYKDIFKATSLEKLTGINQKQILHYSSGLKKPRKEQKEKIINALHALGEELLSLKV